MKLSSTFFGSVLVVLFSAQLGCSGADSAAAPAEGSSESDLKKVNTVKFADFKADATTIADSMSGGGPDNCTFESSFAGGALTLTVSDGKTSTKIVASASDAITLSQKDSGSTRIYKIRGVGTLTLVQADDAFISAAIDSTATKKTSTCEIDF